MLGGQRGPSQLETTLPRVPGAAASALPSPAPRCPGCSGASLFGLLQSRLWSPRPHRDTCPHSFCSGCWRPPDQARAGLKGVHWGQGCLGLPHWEQQLPLRSPGSWTRASEEEEEDRGRGQGVGRLHTLSCHSCPAGKAGPKPNRNSPLRERMPQPCMLLPQLTPYLCSWPSSLQLQEPSTREGLWGMVGGAWGMGGHTGALRG